MEIYYSFVSLYWSGFVAPRSSWGYFKNTPREFLSFAKYVGLCQNNPGAVPTNRPWL